MFVAKLLVISNTGDNHNFHKLTKCGIIYKIKKFTHGKNNEALTM